MSTHTREELDAAIASGKDVGELLVYLTTDDLNYVLTVLRDHNTGLMKLIDAYPTVNDDGIVGHRANVLSTMHAILATEVKDRRAAIRRKEQPRPLPTGPYPWRVTVQAQGSCRARVQDCADYDAALAHRRVLIAGGHQAEWITITDTHGKEVPA